MSDLWSHSHDWDIGYAKGHKDGYQQGRADAIEDCITKLLTESVTCFSDVISILQEQLKGKNDK